MEYNFREIEQKWQNWWKENKVYSVSNISDKPKYYVLDMFPYPSGAGLHVGHPLGYIASDIFSRYKRLKGFNVLHPMGFDSFGLPAEQYAIETGQHPAETTKKNIETFKKQLDKIGFCYDWEREVQTSNPSYYKWTQKIFLELYNSWYNSKTQKAESIKTLITLFEAEGSSAFGVEHSALSFNAAQWKAFSEKEQQDILMTYRLAFSKFGEVNWCEALGTVLANDEVVNGVSERGSHLVVKKKMRQWYLRITAYADRLLQGLETVDFSESMKEMQRNWIGRSEGAEIVFPLSISPFKGEEMQEMEAKNTKDGMPGFGYAKYKVDSAMSLENAKQMRRNPTESEAVLWEALRASKIGYKFRRQHPIENYIADFVCLDVWLIVEVDGEYHTSKEQKLADQKRDNFLKEIGFLTLRFTNEDVIQNIDKVVDQIKSKADELKRNSIELRDNAATQSGSKSPSPLQGEGLGVRVYTTRPDTIFGVDFMVLAPELDLVNEIKSAEQAAAVDEYINYVKSRSDRERQSEVKQISGCFTGAYVLNPFSGKQIPVWISEYVLAGYGTGAIMAVPCGDERDFKFAQHFNIPITNIIGDAFNGQEANATKEAILQNSGFLNGLVMKDAIKIANDKLEELGIGKRKVNFKMRDAGFSRQRYWGEPFPIVWEDGVAKPLSENELPLELPYVEKYGPGPEGQGPLANIIEWCHLNPSKEGGKQIDLTLNPSPKERYFSHPENEQAENKEQVAPLSLGEGLGVRSNTTPKYYTTTIEQWKILSDFSKQNRKHSTDAEDALWQEVRNRKINDCKFRRQHPIAGFIPDFVCLEWKLIIEIDGEYHNEEGQKEYDNARTNWLIEYEYVLIRFTNNEVLYKMPMVLQKIREALQTLVVVGIRNEAEINSGITLPQTFSKRETSTMPGYAGSSWYFLRYMDPNNSAEFVSKQASDYWNQVDLYVGGTEHAVGHLLYSRMWTKVLYDLGFINFDEPFKKLLNQGMIQGSSRFVFRVKGTKKFISQNQKADFETDAIHVDVNMVDGFELDIEAFKKWKNGEYANAEFILDDGSLYSSPVERLGGVYICGSETEKMSKSKYNTVNPDELCEKYGADTFRMYEMFLGPVEASKPWDTKGIEGVHRFVKKLWRLFYTDSTFKNNEVVAGKAVFTNDTATPAELKILHRTIQKIESDTERFSFNTAISAFMVCVNELSEVKCHKKEILEKVLILLTPYAPHIAEELWAAIGYTTTILDANYPIFESKYVVESSKEYPISINGKVRATINLSLELDQTEVETAVKANETVLKWLDGKEPTKIIYVKNRMINIVM